MNFYTIIMLNQVMYNNRDNRNIVIYRCPHPTFCKPLPYNRKITVTFSIRLHLPPTGMCECFVLVQAQEPCQDWESHRKPLG